MLFFRTGAFGAAITAGKFAGFRLDLIAVKTADKDAPWVKTLVDSYHTPEVKAFVDETFKGAVVTSW